MIALSYGITYIWGTVGIILITKYLPKWWGIDAEASAREYETEVRRRQRRQSPRSAAGPLAACAPTGWRTRPGSARPSRTCLGPTQNTASSTWCATATRLGVSTGSQAGGNDVIALGGRRETMTEKMGLIGPEVSDKLALDIPLDTAEIVVTNKDVLKLSQAELRALPDVDQIQVVKLERGGVSIPIGTNTKLQRMDMLSVVGLKDAVSRAGALFGRVVRPSTATDLLTLSLGMILGFLIGAIQFPAFGAYDRSRQCRWPAGVGRHRVVGGLAAPLLRQYAECGPQHPRGSWASSSSWRSSASMPATPCSRS